MKVPIVQFSHTFTYTILFLWTPHMKYDMSSQKSTQNLKNAKKCGNKYKQTFSSEKKRNFELFENYEFDIKSISRFSIGKISH